MEHIKKKGDAILLVLSMKPLWTIKGRHITIP